MVFMAREALVVGINQYPFLKDTPTSKAKHLTTPASDAEAIAQLLEKYGDFQVRRLPENNQDGKLRVDLKKPVKLKELQDAISELFQPKGHRIPETAVLFFAGHGFRRAWEGGTEGYLVTSDAGSSKVEYGLSLQWLRQLLNESPVRQQVIWLDCCNSGELLNFLATDLGEYEKGRDRCFIVASRDFQVAYEAAEGNHGVLSSALLQGLDPTLQAEKWVTNYSLVDFVKQALKDAPQHPICTNSGGQIILTSEQSVISNICPYKGLAYFDFNEEDPKYFYGRTALTNQLLEKVRQSNFLAVLGASGSGKSSVVRAGLLYQLKLGEVIPESDRWNLYEPFTPGEHPLRSLEQAVGVKSNELEAFVKAAPAKRVVLVVDQFEESFTLCRDEAERKQLFECLMGAVKRIGNKLCLVLVMRADFQSKCAEQDYVGLATKINQNLVRVRQMSREELKETITKPAQQVGLEIDRELVSQMIADVEGSPGDLPLLQYTLTELWQHRTLNRLVLWEYIRLGGVKEALGKRANEVYQSFSKEEQLVAKRIFLELTRLGEEAEDTRKQVYQQDLVNSQQPETLVNHVVKRLADANLVVTSERELNGKQVAVVNIAHEALIRNWQQLHNWLTENRDVLLRKQDIEDAAKEWRDKGRPKDSAYLLQGRKLAEAENFQKIYANKVLLSDVAQEFVQESVKERKSSRIRTTGIVTVVILGVSGLASWALIKQENLQLRAISASSETLFTSGKELEGLLASIKAGRRLKRPIGAIAATADTRMLIASELQQVLYGMREHNRLEKHKGGVHSVSFSPDGKVIASASDDETVILWSSDGSLLKTLRGHRSIVNSVSFSPDGQLIASAASDNAVKIWRRDGTLLKTVKDAGWLVRFSPDGQTIASANDDSVKLWTRNGTILRIINSGKVGSLSFSPDSQIIALSGSEQNTVKLWSRDGALLKTLNGRSRIINDVAFSPDNKLIATVGDDRAVKLWSRDGILIKTWKAHTQGIERVSFSPDSQIIASAGWDGTVKLWSRDGTLLQTLIGDQVRIWDISFSPDGKTLASVSIDDNRITLWNCKAIHLRTLEESKEWVMSVGFSPDGKTIASAGSDKIVRLWNRNGTSLRNLEGHNITIRRVRFSPDGKMIGSASDDGIIKLWSRDGTLLKTINSDPLWDIIFSPNSQIVASAGYDKTIKLWSLNGSLLKTLKGHSSVVFSLSFTPDGKTLASSSKDSTIKLWNRNGTLLKNLNHTGDVSKVSFSPDGKIIASASGDNTIKLWRHDGRLLNTLHGHTSAVTSVSFSPDSQIIASASQDNTIKLWSRDGRLLNTLHGHDFWVWDVSFSPDGKTLASASRDGRVILWNLDVDDLVVSGCNWVRDYLNNNPNVSEADRHLCDGIKPLRS